MQLNGYLPAFDLFVPVSVEPSEEVLAQVVAEAVTSPHVPPPVTDSIQAENRGDCVGLSWVVGINKYVASTHRLRFEFRAGDPFAEWPYLVVLVSDPHAPKPTPPPPGVVVEYVPFYAALPMPAPALGRA